MRAGARIVGAAEAVGNIPDGAIVVVGGFIGAGHPEALSAAVEERFLHTGGPRELTLVYAAGQGDRGNRGLNHFAHDRLVKRVVGGHWNLAPKLGKLALENRIEAYNLPQGVLCALFREIAAKRPGVFTQVGLDTFIDPRIQGGRLNAKTTEPLVDLLMLDGVPWLRYRSFPVNVGLIRATTVDRLGNLSLENEGMIGDVLPIAQAVRNHGGLVIAQVERVVERIEDPKSVRVPGILVDLIVVAERSQHLQTFAEPFNPDYVTSAGTTEVPVEAGNFERRIIGLRSLAEIVTGSIVNLGIGLPESIAEAASACGRLNQFTLTVESGPIGGLPASGLSFGCSRFPEAIVDQPAQFDFYDGGGVDLAALGAFEVDEQGNVNVSQFSGGFAGVGGFVNISRAARKLVFCCTFRAGGLEVSMVQNGLKILSEGRHGKFVKRVQQVCFHGPSALARGQQVLFVTERAVFELTREGLLLREVAPGVDLRSGILAQMDFIPIVREPSQMSAHCFAQY